jgi:O-antigen ligase
VFAYVLLVSALISTGSNGGIVSLVAGLSVGSLLAVYHRRGLAAAAPLAAVLALAFGFFATHVSITAIQQKAHESRYPLIRDGIGHGSESIGSRSSLASESIRLWRDGGPLGEGPTSTKVRLTSEMAPYVKEAHDDYAAALVERGAIGFIGLMLLVAALGGRVVGLSRDKLAPDFAAVVPRPHALVGAVVGTMAAMAVVELLHNRHAWTLFAIVACLGVWGTRR